MEVSPINIGLISDTHISEPRKELPLEVGQVFAGVQLILHAGDLYILAVLDWLERIAPVLAARGNGDEGMLAIRPRVPDDPRLKKTQVVRVEGVTIGLVHHILLPDEPPWKSLESQMEEHFGSTVDVVVFGDTHVPKVATYGDVLVVNPGRPNLSLNRERRLGTVGILEVKAGKARAMIIQL